MAELPAPVLRFDVVPLSAQPTMCLVGNRPVADGETIEVNESTSGWTLGTALSAATIEGRNGLFLVLELGDGRMVLARFEECRRPARLLN